MPIASSKASSQGNFPSKRVKFELVINLKAAKVSDGSDGPPLDLGGYSSNFCER
jgi:hypothetical protein